MADRAGGRGEGSLVAARRPTEHRKKGKMPEKEEGRESKHDAGEVDQPLERVYGFRPQGNAVQLGPEYDIGQGQQHDQGDEAGDPQTGIKSSDGICRCQIDFHAPERLEDFLPDWVDFRLAGAPTMKKDPAQPTEPVNPGRQDDHHDHERTRWVRKELDRPDP